MTRLCLALALALCAVQASAYSSYGSWSAKAATVYVNPAHASPWLSPDQIGAATNAALQDWNTQGGADFLFTYGGLTDAGQTFDNRNVVTFAAEPSPEGWIAFTYAWWDASNHLLDADVILYPPFNYVAEDQDCAAVGGYGVFVHDILTHELGHLLGLNHSDDPEATMHIGYAPCSTTQRSLGADDIAGIQALYGVTSTPPPPVITPPPMTACVTNGVTYPLGTQLSVTKGNGQVGAWITAREAEGWSLLSAKKVKSQTTVVMECGAS